jgi:hypothetical protein
MTARINPAQIEEEFLAHITDIAYQALLREGLRGSFLEVQLRLWAQIRAAYWRRKDVRTDEASVLAEAS